MRRLWIPTLSLTEEGKNAMREFMQSDRAPQAMANNDAARPAAGKLRRP